MTDPNRFAGPSETALLRKDIAADAAILAAVAERVAESEAALHGAERAFQEAKEQLDAAQQAFTAHRVDYASKLDLLHVMRGRLHPIRRLPTEVLGEILETYLDAEASAHPEGSDEQWHHLYLAPNTVAQVCRRWRSVACDTPRLWRFISVEFRGRVESMDGDWIAGLAARIARSGAGPARLLIRGPFPNYHANYTDELPGYEPSEWIGPRHVWEPLIALAPRCQAIRIVILNTQVYFGHIGPFLDNDAPALEELAVCLCPAEDPLGLMDDSGTPSPDFRLNLKAPKLGYVALHGVLPDVLSGPAVFTYPGVTHADIAINTDFSREHISALLRRFPSLSDLRLAHFGLPSAFSMDWFAHPGVRHLSFRCPASWLHAGGASAQSFPALESVDIVRSGALSILATGFAATGPFHTIRSLSVGVYVLDDELVRALDLLPRLESVLLRDAILARSFVPDATWMRPPAGSREWRCPALREVRLTGLKEIEPVEPEMILSWLSSRNSAAGAGSHRAIHDFQLEWESVTTWTKDQVDGFEDKVHCLLAK